VRRRPTFIALPAVVALLTGVLCLFAQSNPSRDSYRAAYKSWKEADKALERDAATAGEALAPRTAKAAEAAAVYTAARIAFLRDMSREQNESLKWLEAAESKPLPSLSPAPDLGRFTDREINAVSAIASTFANDPDKAIQQLRQALQREQEALEALRTAVADRQTAQEKDAKAALAAEQARGEVLDQYPILASALAKSEALMEQEAVAWAAYYPALADASRLALTMPAQPVSSNVQGPNLQSQVARALASPDPAPRVPPITPLPLSRYVGVWGYQPGGLFYGSEPEFVDLAVHEEDGHATGTLYARFKLPAGSPGESVIRFDFSGDFTANRIQTFKLETSDGAMGTIELIPGGPFSVLEVNFNTDVKPGKIQHGDVILVKQ